MLYFAYGSNMNWLQMQDRCPSARFLCRAVLPDYKLAFTRKSIKRGCGVADVVPAPGQTAWGVVYEISNLDVENLDRSEGYRPGRERNSYWRRESLYCSRGTSTDRRGRSRTLVILSRHRRVRTLNTGS